MDQCPIHRECQRSWTFLPSGELVMLPREAMPVVVIVVNPPKMLGFIIATNS